MKFHGLEFDHFVIGNSFSIERIRFDELVTSARVLTHATMAPPFLGICGPDTSSLFARYAPSRNSRCVGVTRSTLGLRFAPP
jgi:hypothetical protein